MNEDNFDLAIIDADSIIYMIAHVEKSPALCKKQFDNALKDIVETVGANSAVVFIKGSDNFRYAVDLNYKGHRVDKTEEDVKERITMLYEYAADFCERGDGGEADDYCSFTSRQAAEEGVTSIVAHIDKDLDCIPGWHYNFRKKEFKFVSSEEGYLFLMKQLLTGDSTDNIQGIRGLGPKTADKMLDGIPHGMLWDTIIDTWKNKQPADVWQYNFVRCANCIYMRESKDDLRPLTFEELKERLTWANTDTGITLQNDPMRTMDSCTTSKTSKQEDDTLEESNS